MGNPNNPEKRPRVPDVTLLLPKDNPERIQQLKKKLAEYNERRKKNYHIPPEISASWCSAYILQELLIEGVVQRNLLSQKISRDLSLEGEHIYFSACFNVIEDYVNTGGENTRGGTGLR